MEKGRTKKYTPVIDLSETEHIGMVREIFATITGRYDFLNHLFSLRRDIAWRRFAASHMRFSRTRHYLDVATGTGDLALEVARSHPEISVTGVDFVREMMAVGKDKVERHALSNRLRLLQGDALNLPFASDRFDVAGIAFGIRNITSRGRALQEMKRVIVPGGQVMVLEMHFPRQTLFRNIYYFYLNYILPYMARSFSKNSAAYHYLADSIIHFPSPQGFARIMTEAGLVHIKQYPLTLGITYLHVGEKPE